jgi:hypothetical protein
MRVILTQIKTGPGDRKPLDPDHKPLTMKLMKDGSIMNETGSART